MDVGLSLTGPNHVQTPLSFSIPHYNPVYIYSLSYSRKRASSAVISDSSMNTFDDKGNPEDLDYSTTPSHLRNEDDCYGFETQFNH